MKKLEELITTYKDFPKKGINFKDILEIIQEPEVFSDEYTECLRNPEWKTSSHTVVHQYREFYSKDDYYG